MRLPACLLLPPCAAPRRPAPLSHAPPPLNCVSIGPPALQVLAPAKLVIDNARAGLDLKERESHLRAWGLKKARPG